MADKTQRDFIDALENISAGTTIVGVVDDLTPSLVPGTSTVISVNTLGALRVSSLSDEETSWGTKPILISHVDNVWE